MSYSLVICIDTQRRCSPELTHSRGVIPGQNPQCYPAGCVSSSNASDAARLDKRPYKTHYIYYLEWMWTVKWCKPTRVNSNVRKEENKTTSIEWRQRGCYSKYSSIQQLKKYSKSLYVGSDITENSHDANSIPVNYCKGNLQYWVI